MALISYEQPINELVRVCLRLEHVFKKMDRHLTSQPEKYLTELVCSMIDTVNLLDRPDLKSKLTQELHRYIATLSKLHHLPNISHEKLNDTLKKLERLVEHFAGLQGKIGKQLQENEFIAHIRMRQSSPSTECSFEIPAYYHWLQQSKEKCLKDAQAWLEEFAEVRSVTGLLLYIIRQSAEPTDKVAENGFYSESISQQLPIQLIRLTVDDTLNVYPEISAGKHRLSIRYLVPNIKERPHQTAADVPFQLSCCCI